MVRKSNIVSVGGGLKEGGGMGEPSYHYNSMSWASSSEKSDIELSDEESPAASSCSFSASSVAYFWMYSGRGSTARDETAIDFTYFEEVGGVKYIYPQIDQIYIYILWLHL